MPARPDRIAPLGQALVVGRARNDDEQRVALAELGLVHQLVQRSFRVGIGFAQNGTRTGDATAAGGLDRAGGQSQIER